MEKNPYETPKATPVADHIKPSRSAVWLLRFVAAILWIAAPVMPVAFVDFSWRDPAWNYIRQSHPIPFWSVATAVAILPCLSLLILGAAAWRRSGKLAAVAMGCLLLAGIVGAAVNQVRFPKSELEQVFGK